MGHLALDQPRRPSLDAPRETLIRLGERCRRPMRVLASGGSGASNGDTTRTLSDPQRRDRLSHLTVTECLEIKRRKRPRHRVNRRKGTTSDPCQNNRVGDQIRHTPA